MTAVAYNLTTEEQAELREVFTKLDDNGRSLFDGLFKAFGAFSLLR